MGGSISRVIAALTIRLRVFGGSYERKKDNCSDWSAIHDFMPPGPARLRVNGKCTFPTPGYKVTLKKKVPQGIDPAILLLDKIVTPPSGPQPEVITTIDVTPYEEVTNQRYTEVEVLPDGTKIVVQNVS
jgi:hypothetical protein